MTAAADVIRATVNNRVDNQVARCVSGESPPPPIGPLPNRFTHCRVSRREQSLRPSHTVVTSQTVRRLTGRAWGRRPVRGVRSEEGKSGLKALRAPSPGIRHRAYGPAGYRHDSWLSFESSKATASSSAPRRKTRFSTPTNREPIPGPPGEPTRRWLSALLLLEGLVVRVDGLEGAEPVLLERKSVRKGTVGVVDGLQRSDRDSRVRGRASPAAAGD